ncbi:MAG: DUF1800 domain-containing protein, partial [Bacteroidota bacterium]
MSTKPVQVKPGLEPYVPALSRREVAHLLRRASFGADPETVNTYAGQTAAAVVDDLLTFATDSNANPLPAEPSWANQPQPDRSVEPSEVVRAYNQNNVLWLAELSTQMLELFRSGGLRERMTLFWHNHFVTELEVYELGVYAYRYLRIIRNNALGDFKAFVKEMGLTPAMLIYLNGNTNEKNSPNENYARELLELFTMGPVDSYGNENYSQTDVEEVARALTGWFVNRDTIAAELFNKEFDEGQKVIMGRTGDFDYEGVNDVLFNERPFQIAEFICAQLYREFVYDEPDLEIVRELATIFRESNFQIAPVLRTLLGSSHFFETQFIGAKIKSPADLIAGALLETGLVPSEDILTFMADLSKGLDQEMLDPPDVSGWPGHRAWISTNSLPARWSFADFLLYNGRNNQSIDLTSIAALLPDADDAQAAFKLPLSIAEHFLAVPLD